MIYFVYLNLDNLFQAARDVYTDVYSPQLNRKKKKKKKKTRKK